MSDQAPTDSEGSSTRGKGCLRAGALLSAVIIFGGILCTVVLHLPFGLFSSPLSFRGRNLPLWEVPAPGTDLYNEVSGINWAYLPRSPINFSFSDGLSGWDAGPGADVGELTYSPHGFLGGGPCAVLSNSSGTPEKYECILQNLCMVHYRGKRVRLSAWVQTAGSGGTDLALRLDSRSLVRTWSVPAPEIAGDSPWQKYEIVFDVPADGQGLVISPRVYNVGTLSVADVQLEVVGRDVALTPSYPKAQVYPGNTKRIVDAWMLNRQGRCGEALAANDAINADAHATGEERCTALAGIAIGNALLGREQDAKSALARFNRARPHLRIDPALVEEVQSLAGEDALKSTNRYPGDTQRIAVAWSLSRRRRIAEALSLSRAIVADPNSTREEACTAEETVARCERILGESHQAAADISDFEKQSKDLLIDPDVIAEAAQVRSHLTIDPTGAHYNIFSHIEWAGSSPEPQNLSFASKLSGWEITPARDAGHCSGNVDPNGFTAQVACAFLEAKSEGSDDLNSLSQKVAAGAYLGKRVRLSASLKADNVDGYAYLWLRIDSRHATTIAVNPKPVVTGSSGWLPLDIVLDVPADGQGINFGAELAGSGRVSLANVRFETVGSDVASTPGRTTGETGNSPFAGRDTSASIGAGLAVANPAFASGTNGWYLGGGTDTQNYYSIGANPDGYGPGKPCGFITARQLEEDGWNTLMQEILADDYLGTRVRLTADVKLQDSDDQGNLWLRVDSRDRSILARMPSLYITDTTDWQPYSVVLDVPDDAQAIAFGWILTGTGTASITNVRIEIVGKDVPLTPAQEYAE